jgi:23S rRNA (pseudouridine1915-N3)-methyltransferase
LQRSSPSHATAARASRKSTRALSDKLSRWRIEARDVTFVIGSADGLAESVKRDAAATFSLSALTLPHGLVRIILVEQLYRAVSLLSGHPYHRE